MKDRMYRNHYVSVVLFLVVWIWTMAHSAERKPGMYPVFGKGDMDFVAPVQAIESAANHWKPDKEPLPVDIAECGRKAKQHLLRRRPDIPAGVNLISAEISPFTITTVSPSGALEANSKAQKVAWYLVFTFSNALPDGKQLDWADCTVGMMLDGTILEMVEKGKP